MPINLNYASIATYFIKFYQTTNLKATMRTLRKLGLHLFITIIASLSFASCSDDDDKDNGGNKASATIGTKICRFPMPTGISTKTAAAMVPIIKTWL